MKYNFVESDRQAILKERIDVLQAEYDELCQKFLDAIINSKNVVKPFDFLPLEYYIKNGLISGIQTWITVNQMADDLKLCSLRLQKAKEKLK